MMLHGEVRLVEIFILIAVHMDVLTYQQDLLEAYIHKFMLIYQSLFIDKKRDCIINLFFFLYIILQQRFVLVDHAQFLLHHSQQFDLILMFCIHQLELPRSERKYLFLLT